jgi:N-acetylglutamate synthase-like GNAT family acetyltransferase
VLAGVTAKCQRTLPSQFAIMGGMSTVPRGQRGFRVVRGQEEREEFGRFVMAQGWAGLHLGDILRRFPASGSPDGSTLLGHFGPGGELRGAALQHGQRAHVLLPMFEDRALADDFAKERLCSLERLTGVEGLLSPDLLAEQFGSELRELTVAPVLRVPERRLPAVRKARKADSAALHRIYEQVSWMRLESAELWGQRLSVEPSWVAEVEGRLVAAARWSKSFGQLVEVGGVATDPANRHQGAATAVVVAATAAALSAGLIPVLCFGDPALGPLYYRLGFETVGRERVFHRLNPAQAGI